MNYSHKPQAGNDHGSPDNTEVHPSVIGLTGGNKQIWLRQHHAEVMEYYHRHGPDSTMAYFNMRQYTLTNFLTSRQVYHQKMTKSERALAVAQIAMEGVRDIRGEINEIKDQLDNMAPMVTISYGILAAFKKLIPIIELAEQANNTEPPGVTDLGVKSEK